MGVFTRLARGRGAELLAVAAAYVVTAGFLLWRALDVRSYIWLVDELLYTKGALGFAGGTLSGHVYGARESVHAPLYSWLLSPLYGILNSDHAFKAAHAVDALVFAGVLVPVYLTARYLGARPLMAMLAALLCTWIPYAAATLVLMSESLAYLGFAWAVWAMVRALAEPSPPRDAIALVLIAATAYTRPQFALLFPAFAVAVLLLEIGAADDRPLRERLRPHWLLALAAVLGLLLVAIAGRGLLGGYSHTAGLPRFPPGLWQNMLTHAAHVVVAAALIPAIFWLGWLLSAGGVALDRRRLAFAVLSGLLVALVFYQVGYFSQNVVGGRIQERTAFYVVPLFALGLAALSADLRPRPPRLSFIAAGVAVALVIGAVSFAADETPGAFEAIANPGASYNSHLKDLVHALSGLPTAEGLALAAIVLGALAAVAAAPRFRHVGLPLAAGLALLFCVIETTTVLARDVDGINATIPGALGSASPPKAWVDGALFRGGDAAALEAPLQDTDAYTVWLWTQFWNKKVNRVYVTKGNRAYSGLASLPFDIDQQTGAVHVPLEKPYLVMSANEDRFGLQGGVYKQGPFGLMLFKPQHPYRATWARVGTKPLQVAVFRPPGSVPSSPARVSAPVIAGSPPRIVKVTATIPAGATRKVVTLKA